MTGMAKKFSVREIIEAKLPEPGGGCNVERRRMSGAYYRGLDKSERAYCLCADGFRPSPSKADVFSIGQSDHPWTQTEPGAAKSLLP